MPQPEGWWVQGLMNSPMDFYGPLNLSTTIIETALVVAFKVNKNSDSTDILRFCLLVENDADGRIFGKDALIGIQLAHWTHISDY